MKNKNYLLIGVVIVVVVVVGFALVRLFTSPPATPAGMGVPVVPSQQNPTAGTTTSPSPAAPTTAVSPAKIGSSGTPLPTKIPVIAITSPLLDDQWISGDQNTIQWNRAAGALDGTISLVDAATGATVGWIQQHVSTQQTLFPWNTKTVFVSQTSPSTKDVPTGNYRIVLTFNSSNIPSVTGPVFSIIYSSQAQSPTMPIAIHAVSFSPSSIIVTQGTKLLFTNQDAKSYEITVSSGAPSFIIAPAASYTFDTSGFPVGNYAFYSSTYPSLRLTVAVEKKPQ